MSDKDALIQPDKGQPATDIHLVTKDGFEGWLKGLSAPQRASVAAQKFKGGAGETAIIPDGDAWFAAAGVAQPDDLTSWCLASIAGRLPGGTYRLAKGEAGKALLGWQSAQYKFTRYKEAKDDEDGDRVLLTKAAKAIEPALAEARATALVRDLVNTPAEDMGPSQLEAEAERRSTSPRAIASKANSRWSMA